MKSEQNTAILSALSVEDEMTAYAIAQETGISVPQINFKMDKLIKCGIVSIRNDGVKNLYCAHPVLKNKDAIELIASYIKAVVDTIDELKDIPPEGAKAIIEFILDSVELTDPVDTVEDEILIKDFRSTLERYAQEHGLHISDIKGWTENKIVWMALNDRKCACAPDKRVCPCPEGLIEIGKRGKCKCSVFKSGKR